MGDVIRLDHGSGGRLSNELVQNIVNIFTNSIIDKMDDSALLKLGGKIAYTTDSFVVDPIFFPGGDIGALSIFGTVNDLAMVGAEPLYLTLSLIIEEGLPYSVLNKVLLSIKRCIRDLNIKIVAGDTKVVERGGADKLFINTAGIGIVKYKKEISSSNACQGDKIILSGYIGDHGIAVLGAREKFGFKAPVKSDSAPLSSLVRDMLKASRNIHVLRDPTRGGLATVLNEIAHRSKKGISIEEDKIPIRKEVRGVSEILGLDPLYIANEGKLVTFVKGSDANRVLSIMRQHRYGRNAQIIGDVNNRYPGKVFLKTAFGGTRIVDRLVGEPLPRIC